MIPVTLPSGKQILLLSSNEEDVPEDSTYRDVAFHLNFRDLVDVISEIGVTLHESIEKIAPTKAAIELSVGVDAETGVIAAFFVDGAARGAITVALEWVKS